jgi:hypothetical protein
MIGAGEPLMKHHVLLLLACVITLATSTCFRPSLECAPCGKVEGFCGANLICHPTEKLCVKDVTMSCMADADASASDAVTESPPDSSLPNDTTGEASVPGDTSSPDAEGRRCVDRCCIGTTCLEFPSRLKNGLLLWADRTSMGQPGSVLDKWFDRSLHNHDLMSLPLAEPPRVQSDGVGPIADIGTGQSGMATTDGPSLRLGTDDFSMVALVSCRVGAQQASVFSKQYNSRPHTGVVMFCNHDGAPLLLGGLPARNRAFARIIDEERQMMEPLAGMVVSQRTDIPGNLHVLTARRVEGRRFQLRVDGMVEGEIAIPPSLDLKDETPIFVGTIAPPPYATNFVGGLAAMVVVRGPLGDDELKALEDFLIRSGGEGAPPL